MAEKAEMITCRVVAGVYKENGIEYGAGAEVTIPKERYEANQHKFALPNDEALKQRDAANDDLANQISDLQIRLDGVRAQAELLSDLDSAIPFRKELLENDVFATDFITEREGKEIKPFLLGLKGVGAKAADEIMKHLGLDGK